MIDILERLRGAARAARIGASLDDRGEEPYVTVSGQLLDNAADEIARLREQLENAKLLAGVVTTGPSFASIKRDLRPGTPD